MGFDVITGVGQLVWMENNGAESFTRRVTPLNSSLTTPVSLAIADMDGDGDMDVLATNLFSQASVYLLVNNGAEQFTPQLLSSVGYQYATSVVAADMDRDGDLDVIAGGQGNSSSAPDIIWFQNNGALAFSPRTVKLRGQTSGNTATEAVAVGDVDGDGDLDVVAAGSAPNASYASLSWHEQIAGGAFIAHSVDVGRNLRWAALADVNGDGDLDILTSGHTSSIDVYENYGGTQFARRQVGLGQGAGWSVAAADMDDDGDLDAIATGVAGAAGVAWFANLDLVDPDYGDAPAPYPTTRDNDAAIHNGGGPRLGALRDAEPDGQPSSAADGDGSDDDGVTFAPLRAGQPGAAATVNVQNAPAGALLDAWIDFDGDGAWAAAEEQIAASIAVVEGDNVVTFAVPATIASGQTFARFRLSAAGGLGPGGIALDGEVEDYAVVLSSPTDATAEYPAYQQAFGSGEHALHMVDVDRDGDLDAVGDGTTSPYLFWHENLGGGAFLQHPLSSSQFPVADVISVDLDRDGDMDIAAVQLNRLFCYENNGAQSFRRRQLDTLSSSFEASLDAADADGDGDVDLLVGGSSLFRWYLNDGQQQFLAREILPPFTLGIAAFAVNAVDLDADGDVDMVAAYGLSNSPLTWFENNGAGVYALHQIIVQAPDDILPIDLDGDGDLDLVTRTFGDIEWFEHVGSSFIRHVIWDGSFAFSSNAQITCADFDGDGDLDVAALDSRRPRIFLNDGAQNFSSLLAGPAPAQGVPQFLKSITTADVNGDGRLEVVTAIANGGGWFEAFPFGDYDRSGRVDEADRALWEQTFGQPADPPGSGADGDRNGVVDDADLDGWEQHVGEQFIPRVLAANFSQSNETIDGHDFLAWQRTVGQTVPAGASSDWDLSGKVDGDDLAVWQRQFGQGVVPDLAWINSTPVAPAAPAAEPAPQFALASDVILSPPSTASAPVRGSFALVRRAQYVDAVTTMRDAAMRPIDSGGPLSPAESSVADGPAQPDQESIALEWIDAAFGKLRHWR